MQIANNTVVTIDYTLTDSSGEVLDSSEGSPGFAYLHGANNIIPGLENALSGHKAGDMLNVSVEPENAYGQRDEDKVIDVPRDRFENADSIEVGMHFHTQSEHGEVQVVRVVAVSDEAITIDGNHPLAGATLTFDVSVKAVREATPEELDHGHVHGPEGHHHD
ncbi:MAG: peptidylprolyl isomerase [Gammaproteobacteria bacterium SG8_47]|nr:MAG: peptidylprolyl isomerase [Gammaproteobacteria bacterium SG8_47]